MTVLLLSCKEFDQPLAGFGSVGTHLGMDKIISDLFIQIDAIRDHNKPRFPDLAFGFHALPGDHLCQHNHRDRFCRFALRMPDNTVSGVRIVSLSKMRSMHFLTAKYCLYRQIFFTLLS